MVSSGWSPKIIKHISVFLEKNRIKKTPFKLERHFDLLMQEVACLFNYTRNTMKIGPGEYSFTTALTGRFLRTDAVVACIALSIYCKSTKEGALFHILPGTPQLNEHFQEIRARFKGEKFEINIYSPHASYSFRTNVLKAAKETFGVEVTRGEIDGSCTTYSVALDVFDGSTLIEKRENKEVRNILDLGLLTQTPRNS